MAYDFPNRPIRAPGYICADIYLCAVEGVEVNRRQFLKLFGYGAAIVAMPAIAIQPKDVEWAKRWISVTDFGARKGNDDREAFQKAIDYACSFPDPPILHIPAGKYYLHEARK